MEKDKPGELQHIRTIPSFLYLICSLVSQTMVTWARSGDPSSNTNHPSYSYHGESMQRFMQPKPLRSVSKRIQL